MIGWYRLLLISGAVALTLLAFEPCQNGSNATDEHGFAAAVTDEHGFTVDENGSTGVNGFTATDDNVYINKSAVGQKMGQRIGDEVADKIFGADTEENKVFATDSATDCLDSCSGCGLRKGWGNCIPTDGSAGDKCCAASYKWKCCQVQKEFTEGVPKDLEKLGRLCFETLPVCSATFCESEMKYYAVDKGHPVIGGNTKPSECGAEFFQAIRGDFFVYIDQLDGTIAKAGESFLLENEKGCPKCGWELCIQSFGPDKFSCTCCSGQQLASCRWGWSENCLYEPDVLTDADSLKCPKCGWKMRYSDNNFVCCDREGLQRCTTGLTFPTSATILVVFNV
uniref:Pacifastin domain-containing protein n=1 Tax=Globodera pallida TaxID=36090 RepID=A0A183C483_GLOPA